MSINDDFYKAIEEGDFAKVIAYLDDDPSLLKTRTERGMTPLHIAARAFGDNADIVHLLISRGANVEDVDNTGWVAADWADFMLNYDVLLLLGRKLG